MENNIIESNKLIAEFMGGKYCEYPNKIFPGEYGYHFDNFNPTYKSHQVWSWWNIKSLGFHLSWDWLMPVVEKISSIRLEQYESCQDVH